MATAARSGYSGAQIALHWMIAALVMFQLLFGDDMAHVIRATARGTVVTPSASFWADMHYYLGIAVLALVLARLFIRFILGTPEPLQQGWMGKAAAFSHGAFYILLTAAPILGLLAYYLGKPFGDLSPLRSSTSSGSRMAPCGACSCRRGSLPAYERSWLPRGRALPNRSRTGAAVSRRGCPMNFNKLTAELIGTFTLVAAVLGGALVSFSALGGGSGILGVAIAVGLAVMGMAYAVGPISGGHFNPAVTLGLWSAGRFDTKDIIPYIVAQVIGGFLAALFFYILLSTKADFVAGGFASNGYGEHSPAGFSLVACLLSEIVQTFLFVLVICRVTRANGAGMLAPVAIGLTLTLMHIMSIPIANTSVNPARSTATAIFGDGWALQQLWLFWVAPIIGGLIAGFVDKAWGDAK